MTAISERDLLRHATRSDFKTFCDRAFGETEPGRMIQWEKYLDLFVEVLRELEGNDGPKRQIVNLPPRHLKSFLCSVCWPAWLLGHQPSRQIIVVTHSQGLAREFADKSRRVMSSEWYLEAFPETRIRPERSTVADFETTAGGARLSVSMDTGVSGRSADTIIADDPLDVSDAESDVERARVNHVFDASIARRVRHPAESCILAMGHRVHEDDLFGHLLAQGGYDDLSLPMQATESESIRRGGYTFQRAQGELLSPIRIGPEGLARITTETSAHIFQIQYQQWPSEASGGMLTESSFRIACRPKKFDQIVVSWDLASTDHAHSSYSVAEVWGKAEGRHYLIDVWRSKAGYPVIKEQALHLQELHGPSIQLVEAASLGSALVKDLKVEGVKVDAIAPGRRSKRERLEAAIHFFNRQEVVLVEDAPWMVVFLNEVCRFPYARFSDQVDAMTQYLNWQADHPTQPNDKVIRGTSSSPRAFLAARGSFRPTMQGMIRRKSGYRR